ncbi:MFS transporter [Lactobacillus taiwanensis]|uniref:MFS transporter n=1 Tax=Lactobacillus taiwanensis TaxID=508451 RepID=UPI000B98C41E|nr:MFS transporter [Lactobacillus taiwanensis]OYR94737.1 hypothetical protein CBF51_10190 [Lactobacillus taiwanensis]OYR99765.1 hypothetical protein CBF61_08470 [Lactobacillus taiwanensis]OYS12920.1 hypothetical protein CBF69_09965 [Lactobacillus taiwanensis]OYS30357.1 hypothetical protein CBF75_08120 [Lactobacillus taiwanensis]OYS31494.1 hypothetical protein CBF78_08755 [Lactobacillus taiwanensis]
MLQIIRNKYNLGKLYTADALSEIGDVFYYVALVVFAGNLSQSALAITLVTTFEYIPPIFSVLIGNLADKIKNKTKTALIVNISQCILYLMNAILFLTLKGWTLLIACIVINFLSDTIGIITEEIEPVILNRLSPEILFEKKYGMLNAVSQACSIGGKFIGGLLLALFNNHYVIISIINAVTFAGAALCFWLIKSVIVNRDEENTDNNTNNAILYLKEHENVKHIIFFMTNLNIVLAPLLPIIYILLSKKNLYTSLPYSVSISTLTAIDSIASILGPLLGVNLFKGKQSLNNSLIYSGIFSTLFCCSLFTQNLYVVYFSLFLSSFFVGAAIPLMFGEISREVPESKLGSVNGLIDSILAITPPVSTFLFSILTEYVPIKFLIGLLVSYSLLLSFLLVKNRKMMEFE